MPLTLCKEIEARFGSKTYKWFFALGEIKHLTDGAYLELVDLYETLLQEAG